MQTYYNWYKIAQLEKEAGLKESALHAALIAIMGGMNLFNASNLYRVDPSELQNLLNEQKIQKEVYDPMKKNINDVSQKDSEQKTNNELTEKQKIQENIIARTIYAEGKGESLEGMNAIASVIFNRGNGTLDGVIDAIKKPKQFSCWNGATESDWTNMKQGKGSSWDAALSIAHSIVNGSFSTDNSWNHYYNPKLANPYWAYNDNSKTTLRPYESIGNHNFLTL